MGEGKRRVGGGGMVRIGLPEKAVCSVSGRYVR